MNKKSNNLVFLAIGERYNKQCLFALLTLLNVYNKSLPKSIKIYVFTDKPGFYDSLKSVIAIQLIFVNNNTLQKWINNTNFFLRAKIYVIKEFLANHSGNMIFADTDVIFKKRLDFTFKNISKGKVILLLRESRLSSGDYKEYLSCFGNNRYVLSSGRILIIDKKSEMWNSGLIGISSYKAGIIDDVLELCDQLLKRKSSRFLEQLAFSLVFQNTSKLQADQSKLVHYWWSKPMLNAIIDETLKNGYSDIDYLLSKAKTLDPTNRTTFLRFYYNLHPKSILRKVIKKVSIMLDFPMK
jgi:choline kinase